jgi:hypothetical protein
MEAIPCAHCACCTSKPRPHKSVEINTRLEPERNLQDWMGIGGQGDWVDEKPHPRYSKNFQDDHFYNTRGIWGNFQVGCGSQSTSIGLHHIRHHQATNNKVAASEARTVA